MAPGRAKRTSAVMDYLKDLFGDPPPAMVVMLQEVHDHSLTAILAHQWIRKNFVLSNAEAPQRYFTIVMVSRHLRAENWFRVPFQSRMERDALVVDIELSNLKGELDYPKRYLRLSTTHLESLPETEGDELRPRQLAQISALLKAPSTHRAQIIGGIVGGDMNAISPTDAFTHKAHDIDLHDVWEDTPPSPIPARKPFQKDLTYGKAKGNTWGYQSQRANSRKRLDKFFYTGLVETMALVEPQDLTGKVGRLGIGIKTNIQVWEYEEIVKGLRIVRGMPREYPIKRRFDTEQQSKILINGERKEIDTWISDHFGIAIGVKVC